MTTEVAVQFHRKKEGMIEESGAQKGRIEFIIRGNSGGRPDKVSPRGSHQGSVTLEYLIATHSSVRARPLAEGKSGQVHTRGSRPSRTVISMKIDKSRGREDERKGEEDTEDAAIKPQKTVIFPP